MVSMEIGKCNFSVIIAPGCYEEEKLCQKLKTTTVKIVLIGSVQGEIKYHYL